MIPFIHTRLCTALQSSHNECSTAAVSLGRSVAQTDWLGPETGTPPTTGN